jgi:hypothetical protein
MRIRFEPTRRDESSVPPISREVGKHAAMARYGAPHKGKTPAPAPLDGRKTGFTVRLDPSTRTKAVAVSDALGISLSALVAELIDRLEVNENNRPGWESRYAPPDDAQEALEMSA